MKKSIERGAAALIALLLFGMTPRNTYAAEQNDQTLLGQGSPKETQTDQTAGDTDAVMIPDAKLSEAICSRLAITNGKTVTKADMAKLTTTDNPSQGGILDDVKDFTGLETAVNLTQLTTQDSHNVTDPKMPGDLSQLSKLTMVAFSGTDSTTGTNGLKDASIQCFSTLPGAQLEDIVLANNQLTDLTPLKNKCTATASYLLGNQKVTDTAQVAPKGALTLSVKEIKNIDGSTPVITPKNGGVLSKDGKTITWTNLPAGTSEVSYSWAGANTFSGEVTVPVTVTNSQAEKTDAVDVEYDATVPPTAPSWYGVVPEKILFNDTSKTVGTEVSVSNGKNTNTPYGGNKTVAVMLQSQNGFQLIDGTKPGVSYQVKREDGTVLDANTSSQLLGALSKDKATLHSKAVLTGTATESGKYKDTLYYSFTEK